MDLLSFLNVVTIIAKRIIELKCVVELKKTPACSNQAPTLILSSKVIRLS